MALWDVGQTVVKADRETRMAMIKSMPSNAFNQQKKKEGKTKYNGQNQVREHRLAWYEPNCSVKPHAEKVNSVISTSRDMIGNPCMRTFGCTNDATKTAVVDGMAILTMIC